MVRNRDILDAAFRLFCKRGYSLSMADIAAIVGLKTPSLYSHYSGKDEIIEEMINREVASFYAYLDRSLDLADKNDPALGIKKVFTDIIEYFSEYSRLRFWRSIPLIPKEKLRRNFAAMISRHDGMTTEKMKTLFQRGIALGEIRNTADDGSIFLFIAMIQGVLDGMLLYHVVQGKAFFAEQVFNAYWSGIRAESSTE